MAQDHRININGHRVPYSCENRRYRTDLSAGEPHRPYSDTRGSVIAGPLVEHSGHSLWLEHVEEIEARTRLFWLMWYGPDSLPTMPMSGVFDEAGLRRMIKLFEELNHGPGQVP